MPIMTSCAGCGKTITQEDNTPVLTPKTKRTIAYVHTLPKSTHITVVPYCHRLAYQNLKDDYPEIVISDRVLNAEAATHFPKRRPFTGESRAAKFTSRASGSQAFAIHFANRSTTPIQSSF